MPSKILMACALILSGAGCTTAPPLTPFPTPPDGPMQPCERPAMLPKGSAPPSAADALATVTANYSRHHTCADRLDALQGWVIEQGRVR